MLLVPTTTRLLSSLFVALTLLRRLAALLGRPGQVLRDPELNNAADQIRGQGLAEGKLHRAFSDLVGFEIFLERLQPARRRIETDVPRIAYEVDEMFPVQVERRDRVADRLRSRGARWP